MTEARYEVKCDDCKTILRHTTSLTESAAGGTCSDCWHKARIAAAGRYAAAHPEMVDDYSDADPGL